MRRYQPKPNQTSFANYDDAYHEALYRARKYGIDYGLSCNRDFGGSDPWTIRMLPKAEHRQGSELTCETVTASNPFVNCLPPEERSGQ